MSDDFNLATHYPWLPSSLTKFYSNLFDYQKISDFIYDIFSSDNEEITARTYEIFKAAFDNLENVLYYKLDKVNVYLYLLIRIILSILDNKIITNRVANLYSKINYYDLLNENDYNIYYICKEELNLNHQYNQEPELYGFKLYENVPQPLKTEFKMHYIDYLKLSKYLRDDYRKLVNNYLSKGYVYLTKKRLIRLIQEEVRNKILEVEEKVEEKDDLIKIEGFKELYERILALWKDKKEDYENLEFDGTEDRDLYPPCMQELISKAKEGQNLIHIERLVILFFFLELSVPLEEIVNFFSSMPDFDKEKTTYQVNFAKRKGYKAHLCETLKSLDLCKAIKDKEKICTEGYYSITKGTQREIRSPLQYVYVKKHRIRRKEGNKNNTKK